MTRILKTLLLLSVLGLVSAEANATPLPSSEKPFALTISGGISLGVYEAGLNWVLVENLRKHRDRFQLETITGASAGAINTLVSAMRFAEHDESNDWEKVDHNLFRETWINIDITNLMPDDLTEYDQLDLDIGGTGKVPLKDSLFSRKIFIDVINNLRELADQPRYREGVSLDIALVVTRSKPLETRFMTATGKQSVHSQRFVIPLTVTTEKLPGSEGHARLVFKNNLAYAVKKGNAMEHLFLPESAGVVKFDQVARAAMASSAFPMAFGRVNMHYCVSEEVNDIDGKIAHGICPDDYLLSSGFFIDGGTFDNVPIGVAIDLIDQKSDGARAANYIYMDPANRRSTMPTKGSEDRDSGSLTLQNQVNTWTPAFATLMNGELYRTLLQKFAIDGNGSKNSEENRQRILLLTRRFPPLTGNYISHFGAFFDPSFRNYDYSVGVYDGLMNIVDFLCDLSLSAPSSGGGQCSEQKKAGLFLDLASDILDLNNRSGVEGETLLLIRKFLEWEKGSPAWQPTIARFPEANADQAEWSPAYTVYDSFRDGGSEDGDFTAFLARLEPNKDKFSSRTREMIEKEDNWKLEIVYQALTRLIELEKGGEFEQQLKAASILVNSKKERENESILDVVSSVPDLKTIYRFVPDEIAIDGAQTGIVVSWHGEPKFFINEPFSLEVAGSLHFQLKEIQNERVNFWSAGPALRYSFRNIGLSSMGIGLNINQNFRNYSSVGNEVMVGAEVHAGFLADKFRITIGTRCLENDYVGEDWFFRLGINDIDSLLYLMGL